VLVQEVSIALGCRLGGKKVYLDCTVGMGGHAEVILNATEPEGRVIGIDRDEDALALAAERLSRFQNRVTLRKSPFMELLHVVTDLGVKEVDGILFDLGVSSLQLDRPERGFSFQRPGPLDMRMDRTEGESAADWINSASERELVRILQEYGEERWSKRIASAIVRHRSESGTISRTEALEEIIWKAVPAKDRHRRIHPATRTFQALRMVINQEIPQLEAGLKEAISLLAVGGRLVVISFHSLEDRLVKQTFRAWSRGEVAEKEGSARCFVNLYKKPVRPGEAEIARNPRARSAKLRALERVA
ncbi:MAG: 16S rRNA (cytosine(1402)-N(4))-methyltransferase RsmH, partial [Candidatus Manganitrophaceae bacterium]